MISTQHSHCSRVAAIAALAVSIVLFPRTVRADDDTAAAKAHYTTGLQHFNLAEFEQALTEFKEAYRSKPDPAFLFNIGQCHRKLGHVDDTITFYQSYLREAPDAKNRNEVERRIEELESLRDAQSATTSSLGAKAGPPPTSQAAQEQAVAETAAMGPTAGIELGTSAQAPTRSAGPIYRRWWFWAATGAVVAAAATVAVLLARRDPTMIPGSTLGAQRAMP